MPYTLGYIYDTDGSFVGATIVKELPTGDLTLQSAQLWSDEELDKIDANIASLNRSEKLSTFWPRRDDPDVQTLISDPEWEPIEMEPQAVPDPENSTYVYRRDPHTGDETSMLDLEASSFSYKQEMMPKDDTAPSMRIRKAQEIVAERRAQ